MHIKITYCNFTKNYVKFNEFGKIFSSLKNESRKKKQFTRSNKMTTCPYGFRFSSWS